MDPGTSEKTTMTMSPFPWPTLETDASLTLTSCFLTHPELHLPEQAHLQLLAMIQLSSDPGLSTTQSMCMSNTQRKTTLAVKKTYPVSLSKMQISRLLWAASRSSRPALTTWTISLSNTQKCRRKDWSCRLNETPIKPSKSSLLITKLSQ